MEDLYERIQKIKGIVKERANEVSYSMSQDERDQVLSLLEHLKELEELTDDFEKMMDKVWERADVF